MGLPADWEARERRNVALELKCHLNLKFPVDTLCRHRLLMFYAIVCTLRRLSLLFSLRVELDGTAGFLMANVLMCELLVSKVETELLTT